MGRDRWCANPLRVKNSIQNVLHPMHRTMAASATGSVLVDFPIPIHYQCMQNVYPCAGGGEEKQDVNGSNTLI